METIQNIDISLIIKSINSILEEIINENNDSSKKSILETQKTFSFYSKKIPSISISSYLDRIIKYTKMEESTLVLMLIYVDRICESNNFLLTENNIHRIIITACVLAVKYNEDDYYANTFYAKVGGISLDEINQLEYDFLNMCDFSMGIKPKKFQKYQEYLSQFIE